MKYGMTKKISSTIELFLDANSVVVLTGAGVSTESGIPDFRGKTGIWKEFNPIVYGNVTTLQNDPRFFWELAKKIAPAILSAKPNPGHYALAELEKLGKIKCVITQNIDGLHQKAGSINVFEVHGSVFNDFICVKCSTAFPYEEAIPKASIGIPKCDLCGGFLKPDVVLFGDSLPEDQICGSQEAIKKADLMIVAGSALEVFPVNQLPQILVNQGGKVIIVNDEPTWLDGIADVVFHEKTGIILPKIVEGLKKKL